MPLEVVPGLSGRRTGVAGFAQQAEQVLFFVWTAHGRLADRCASVTSECTSQVGTQDDRIHVRPATHRTEQAGATTLTLKQDNNASQEEADRMVENNWAPVLEGPREVVEKQPSARKK